MASQLKGNIIELETNFGVVGIKEGGGIKRIRFGHDFILLMGIPVFDLNLLHIFKLDQVVDITLFHTGELSRVHVGKSRPLDFANQPAIISAMGAYCNTHKVPAVVKAELIQRVKKYCRPLHLQHLPLEEQPVKIQDMVNAKAEIIQLEATGGMAGIRNADGVIGSSFNFKNHQCICMGVRLNDINLFHVLKCEQQVSINVKDGNIVLVRVGKLKLLSAKPLDVYNAINGYCITGHVPPEIVIELIQRVGISKEQIDELKSPKLNSSVAQESVSSVMVECVPQGAKPKRTKKKSSKPATEIQNIVPIVEDSDVCAVIVFVQKAFGKVKITGGDISCLLPFTRSAIHVMGVPLPKKMELNIILHAKQVVTVKVQNNKIVKLWIGPQRSMESINQLVDLVEYCRKNKIPNTIAQRLQNTLLEALNHHGAVGPSVCVDNLLDLSDPENSGTIAMSSYQIDQELIDLNVDCDAPSSHASEIDLENLEPIYKDRKVVTLGDSSGSESSSDSDDEDDVINFTVPTDNIAPFESVRTSEFLLQLEMDLASFLARNNFQNNRSLATIFMEEHKKKYYQDKSSTLKESHLIPEGIVTPSQHDTENSPLPKVTTVSALKTKSSQTTSTGHVLMQEIYFDTEPTDIAQDDW